MRTLHPVIWSTSSPPAEQHTFSDGLHGVTIRSFKSWHTMCQELKRMSANKSETKRAKKDTIDFVKAGQTKRKKKNTKNTKHSVCLLNRATDLQTGGYV